MSDMDEIKPHVIGGMFLIAFLTFMITSVATWVMTTESTTLSERQEAVKEGHAVWVPDERGKAVFKWLPACKPNFLEDRPKERKP